MKKGYLLASIIILSLSKNREGRIQRRVAPGNSDFQDQTITGIDPVTGADHGICFCAAATVQVCVVEQYSGGARDGESLRQDPAQAQRILAASLKKHVIDEVQMNGKLRTGREYGITGKCKIHTPRTRPVLEKVLVEERKLDFDALVEEALATCKTEFIRAEF